MAMSPEEHRVADLISRNTAISAVDSWQLASHLLEDDDSGGPDAISFNTAPERWERMGNDGKGIGKGWVINSYYMLLCQATQGFELCRMNIKDHECSNYDWDMDGRNHQLVVDHTIKIGFPRWGH